jgi:hypothetical protein
MFQALGVTIDVSTLHNGLVKLGNTESRRKELIDILGFGDRMRSHDKAGGLET